MDIIGKKLRHVGTIEARREQEAIEKVVALFRIQPGVRDKLVAATRTTGRSRCGGVFRKPTQEEAQRVEKILASKAEGVIRSDFGPSRCRRRVDNQQKILAGRSLALRFSLTDPLLRQQVEALGDGQVSAAGYLIRCGLSVGEARGGVRPIAGGFLQGRGHLRVQRVCNKYKEELAY